VSQISEKRMKPFIEEWNPPKQTIPDEFLRRRIAVLAGGPSCEREISLISGKAVFDALSGLGLPAILLDPGPDFVHRLKEENISFVFIALHGSFGEDGTVQRLLDQARIPYTGSGALASALAFDKSSAQPLFAKAGIPIPEFRILKKDQAVDFKNFTLNGARGPLVVKPAKAGSSVGVHILSDPEGLRAAAEDAFLYSDTVLVERYIPGRELTVGILDGVTLPIVEVIASQKFYDYKAKYQDNRTRYEFPAKLDAAQAQKVSKAALLAYQTVGCEVMGRVDIILSLDDTPYVLEVNTIPGLTGKSLLPKAAQALGIDFPRLCVKIIELSLKKRMALIDGKTG
jgi:D-alanine-D-alanine ligase